MANLQNGGGMKSVWVIEQGCYSDYRVVGVYTAKEKAERVADALNASENSWDRATIAEWPIDPGYAEINQGRRRFSVVMLRDGTVERSDQEEIAAYSLSDEFRIWERTKAPAFKGKGIADALTATVWGRDQKHAVKIVNERRAQMIASGEWQ